MSDVDIGKKVDYKTLETALIKAAEEIGWKARVEDKFKKNYRLGSVQEVQNYEFTQVFLSGKLLPAMRVIISKNVAPINRFSVWAGIPYGFAPERKVQEYLSAVSKNL